MPHRWMIAAFSALILTASQLTFARAFDMSRSDNLAVYWGQATGVSLSDICKDDTIDTIPIAFLASYDGVGGAASMVFNLAGNCNPNVGECAALADDIKACQKKGKILTLSVGGAVGSIILISDSEAEKFAELIYDTFLGGKTDNKSRPLGDAVLDGIDLDIEGGGTVFFDKFVNRMWDYASENGDKKKYYLTAAPQCPYPDVFQGAVLNTASFDAVYVQFYNNMPTCGLTEYPKSFNYDSWHDWATTKSANKDVKVYVGAPASESAGRFSVDAATLGKIAKETREKYSSFGGVMLWDAVSAKKNNNFDKQVKDAIRVAGGATPPTSSTSSASKPTSTFKTTASASSSEVTSTSTATSSTSSPSTTSTSGSADCERVDAWEKLAVYVAGDEVIYNGHLYVAKWWSSSNPPTDPADAWNDEGPCGDA